MNITEYREICQKGGMEPFYLSKYIFRPLTIYLSIALIKLRVSANLVTFISLLFAVSSSFVLIMDENNKYAISAILLFLYLILDHVDGEIARFYQHNDPSPSLNVSGKFFDRIIHYIHGMTMFACLGFSLFFHYESSLFIYTSVLGILGASGLPRYIFSYELLNVTKRTNSEEFFKLIDESSNFNFIHIAEESVVDRPASLFSVSSLTAKIKQFIGFPTHLILYILVALSNDITLICSYFFIYSSIFFTNIIYSFVIHFKVLKRVPR